MVESIDADLDFGLCVSADCGRCDLMGGLEEAKMMGAMTKKERITMKYQMPVEEQYRQGFKSDLRFRLAITFLEKWGMVIGHVERQDGAERAICDPMPVDKVVERAFAIASLAVAEAEDRGWLAEFDMTPEELYRRMGNLEGLRTDSLFERKKAQ